MCALFGFAGIGLGGMLGLLDSVEPFLAGLLVHFEEVLAKVVVKSFSGGAAVASASLAFRDFSRPSVILCMLAYYVVFVKVLG